MTISNYDGWKLSFFYSVTSEKAIQKVSTLSNFNGRKIIYLTPIKYNSYNFNQK